MRGTFQGSRQRDRDGHDGVRLRPQQDLQLHGVRGEEAGDDEERRLLLQPGPRPVARWRGTEVRPNVNLMLDPNENTLHELSNHLYFSEQFFVCLQIFPHTRVFLWYCYYYDI